MPEEVALEQNSEQQDPKELVIEALNNKLTGWMGIWNGLRGNEEFPQQAQFLWRNIIEGIYKRAGDTAATVLIIKLPESAYQRLQTIFPDRVQKVVEQTGQGQARERLLFRVDTADAVIGTDNSSLTLYESGNPGEFKLGANLTNNKGVIESRAFVLEPKEIIGLTIEEMPATTPPAAQRKQ